ncbi:hypothetical protein PHYPSEUDO_012781 [Phytophthora pseudosyringae]|uniref:PDZ domain-containing protein n=1 Tax=Phytophthora pseudosyringae TaxID=221518 RepID=A0A8T1V714_9STRA|nr:hypothetical protein PHYPSEUDO_012781 [Phytophthora pseudosyringae]
MFLALAPVDNVYALLGGYEAVCVYYYIATGRTGATGVAHGPRSNEEELPLGTGDRREQWVDRQRERAGLQFGRLSSVQGRHPSPFHTADHFHLFEATGALVAGVAVRKRLPSAHVTTPMRFFSSSKRRTHGLNAKLPPPPASLQSSMDPKETTIVYTGGALCVTLQRANSRFLEEEGPTRLVWSKDERLGLTFVKSPQGGVAVKDVPGMRSDVSPGQELIGVSKASVMGRSLQDVLELLQSARSPCVLDFTPPPSPIVVSEVLGPARLLGVRKGMVLRSVSDSSMVGAQLADVGSALHGASESSPIRLTFTPYDTVVHRRVRSPSLAKSPRDSRANLRNTLCIGAVVAAFSL